jgi:hydrogenase 3 maturation protease
MPSRKRPSRLLQQNLQKSLLKACRIALIGVGSELRGDDIAGVAVAEKLNKSPRCPSILKAFIGCTAPENITGEVTNFLSKVKGKDGHIIVVDAADMDIEPGAIKLLDPEEITGTTFSTHVLPLAILIDYFKNQLDCGITVIAIQPKSTSFDSKPSPQIKRAINTVTSLILKSLPV